MSDDNPMTKILLTLQRLEAGQTKLKAVLATLVLHSRLITHKGDNATR